MEMFAALLSQFMHGEQGAMMTAAKIVDSVPWIDAKYYAATQTMDEARHTEVFARYIEEKVGEAYPMNPNLEAQITGLLEDSRWDIAYLGMQIVIESLALAAFGDMARRIEEPLLKRLLRYVMADEARHVAFGILSLGEYYEHAAVVCVPSRREGYGMTAREALAHERPVVATRVGGLADLTTGVVHVPPRDPDALRFVLEALLTDRERRAKLGAAGRQFAQTRFSQSAASTALLGAYERAASAP